MKSLLRVLAFVGIVAAHAVAPSVGAQGLPGGEAMPDPKQMSGIPLPVADIARGTVTVRVIKGSLSNPISGHSVELHGGSTPLTSKTNEAGRAEFSGLATGARVKAVAVVDGERLESQEFPIPDAGGIRVMLVATDPEAAKRAEEDRKLATGPAQRGAVVLGEQSRFVFELGDEGLSVFNILQILNTARTPVLPAEPLVFDLPEDAEGAALLEGSSPQATVDGLRITVTGPFAPGTTLVQFAYSVHYSGASLTVEQRLPAQLTQLTVLAQKVGNMQLSSPRIAASRDMSTEGQTYIVAQGPAVKAGDVLAITFDGLPHTPTWPRNVALVLAVLIIAAGAWGSVRGSRESAAIDRRTKLQAQRDRLFSDLTAVERQYSEGRIDRKRYEGRRRDLVSGLERIYAELDELAAA